MGFRSPMTTVSFMETQLKQLKKELRKLHCLESSWHVQVNFFNNLNQSNDFSIFSSPGMVLTPVLVNYLENKTNIMKRFRWANSPIQVLFCGVCLTFATPLCCALFSQRASIAVDSLEIELRDKIRKENPSCTSVSYNKGL